MENFENLSPETQQAYIDALSKQVTPKRWALMQKAVAERTKHVTIALEDIYQAHNAAAVVRSCDGFGIQDLHVIEEINKINLSQTSVSKGASKWLDIHYHRNQPDNTTACLSHLKTQGYTIAATALGKNAIKIEDVPLNKPIALLIGTEKDGLTESACSQADLFVELPMYGFTQSYNLSVCAAICLHNLTLRLRQSNIHWQLSNSEKNLVLFNWLKKCIKYSHKILEGI